VDALTRWRIFILFCFVFLLAADDSHAGAVLYRVQQMRAMKEHQNQQMTQEEYAAYQQQQQAQAPAGQPAQPAQPTYQQTIDQRNQAIAQAIITAQHQPAGSENEPFGNSADTGPAKKQPAPSAPAIQQASSPTGSSDVKEVVDLSEVWKKLDVKSTVWTLLIDDQAKALTVSEYINRFHSQGVKISEPPDHYVQMIDQIVAQNPDMLQRPFGELVQIVAIVDYDFDNGMNKDDLARKILGEQGFEENKKRFTQQPASGANPGS